MGIEENLQRPSPQRRTKSTHYENWLVFSLCGVTCLKMSEQTNPQFLVPVAATFYALAALDICRSTPLYNRIVSTQWPKKAFAAASDYLRKKQIETIVSEDIRSNYPVVPQSPNI